MTSFWKYFAAILGSIVVIWGIYALGSHNGVKKTTAKYELTLANIEKVNSSLLAAERQKLLDAQAAHSVALGDIQKQAAVERGQLVIDYEKVIADYNLGNLRLRKELTGLSAAAAGMPDSGSTPGAPQFTQSGGLQPEHVRFLVREAHRANQVAVDYNELLKICQSNIDFVNRK